MPRPRSHHSIFKFMNKMYLVVLTWLFAKCCQGRLCPHDWARAPEGSGKFSTWGSSLCAPQMLGLGHLDSHVALGKARPLCFCKLLLELLFQLETWVTSLLFCLFGRIYLEYNNFRSILSFYIMLSSLLKYF